MRKQPIVPQGPLQEALMNLTKPKRYKLKTIVFTYIVGQMLQIKERQEMAEIFEYIDKDGDGSIDLDEIVEIYRQEFNEPPN